MPKILDQPLDDFAAWLQRKLTSRQQIEWGIALVVLAALMAISAWSLSHFLNVSLFFSSWLLLLTVYAYVRYATGSRRASYAWAPILALVLLCGVIFAFRWHRASPKRRVEALLSAAEENMGRMLSRDALRLFREVRVQSRKLELGDDEAHAICGIGMSERFLGRYLESRQDLADCIDRESRIKPLDRLRIGQAEQGLGHIDRLLGDYSSAEVHDQAAITSFSTPEDHAEYYLADALRAYAHLQREECKLDGAKGVSSAKVKGECDAAVENLRKAKKALQNAAGDPEARVPYTFGTPPRGRINRVHADILRAIGDLKAQTGMEERCPNSDARGSSVQKTDAHNDFDEALATYQEAFQAYKEDHNQRGVAHVYEGLGAIRLKEAKTSLDCNDSTSAETQLNAAIESFMDALRIYESIGEEFGAGRAMLGLSKADLQLGSMKEKQGGSGVDRPLMLHRAAGEALGARDRFKSSKAMDFEAQAEYELGKILEAAGNNEESINHLQQAAYEFSNLRQERRAACIEMEVLMTGKQETKEPSDLTEAECKELRPK